jgi:hypothetical protein
VRRPASGERAPVLGGGGSTGNAWAIGVLAGLAEAGLDVTEADRLSDAMRADDAVTVFMLRPIRWRGPEHTTAFDGMTTQL